MEETKVVEKNSDTSKKSAAKKSKKSDDGAFAKVSNFFTGVKAEFGKIIWPTKDDIIKQTTAVVIVSAICCALIAILDIAFEYGVNFITSLF
jgi:preprotein translocase subunit SecE